MAPPGEHIARQWTHSPAAADPADGPVVFPGPRGYRQRLYPRIANTRPRQQFPGARSPTVDTQTDDRSASAHRARVFPGRRGIDNVYGPTGRTHHPTTAGLDTKRREPGSKLLPSRREPAHRAPRHHEPSAGPSTIQYPTPMLTDNHNGYTQTIIRVLR